MQHTTHRKNTKNTSSPRFGATDAVAVSAYGGFFFLLVFFFFFVVVVVGAAAALVTVSVGGASLSSANSSFRAPLSRDVDDGKAVLIYRHRQQL